MGKLKSISMTMGTKESPWALNQDQVNTLLKVGADDNLTKRDVMGYVHKSELSNREKYLLESLGLTVTCDTLRTDVWSAVADNSAIAPGESMHIILAGDISESEVSIVPEYTLLSGNISLSAATALVSIDGTTVSLSTNVGTSEFLLQIKLKVTPIWDTTTTKNVTVRAGTVGTVALTTTFNRPDYSADLQQTGTRKFIEEYVSQCKCYVFDAFATKKAEIASVTFDGDYTNGMISGDVTFADGSMLTIAELNDAGCNFMVLRPDLYYKVDGEDFSQQLKLYGSNAIDGANVWNKRYLGMFKGYIQNTVLKSQPGRIPTGNQTIANFQAAAKRGGNDYGIWNFNDWCRENALHLSYFGNTNYEKNIGTGRINNYDDVRNIVTGFTLPLIGTDKPYGVVQTVDALGRAVNCLNFFNIEGMGEQIWEFVNGFRHIAGVGYVWDENVWDTAHQGDWNFNLQVTSASGSYIRSIIGGEHFNVMPMEVGGGSTIGFCDGHWVVSDEENGRLLAVGGAAYLGSLCGLSASYAGSAFGYAYGNHGSRLAFFGDPTTVNGVDIL